MTNETSAKAAFDWARRVGPAWRLLGGDAPENARTLLRVAFFEDACVMGLRPGELLRQHDRALGVAVVLSGLSPVALSERAARRARTQAFAAAAAWAYGVGDREPEAFQMACRLFRRIRGEWEDGTTAAFLGIGDASRGPVFQKGRREAHAALVRRDTWAMVGRLRAEHAKDEGFAAGGLGAVDTHRLVRDGAYRAGVFEGMEVLRLAGEAVVRVELTVRAPRRRAA